MIAFAHGQRGEQMRLIDADALQNEYMKNNNGKRIVMVDLAPTIQPPELKKGEWAYHTYIPHNKYCPFCRKDSPYNKRWDHCPYCGANLKYE